MSCDKSKDLEEVHKRIDAEMCGLTQEWALDSLGIENLLPLITIAENDKLGITKAVLYAYRFGYLAKRKEVSACDPVKAEIFEMLKEVENPRELRMIQGFVRGAYDEQRKAVQTNDR